MSAERIPHPTLDQILALQLTVAWAGEGLCEPPRLGWWQTDLVDELGGGDLLARLLPRSHRWAALETVRQAAVEVDRQARQALARPDRVRTLFCWGFEVDEKLGDRLAWHKRVAERPAEVLAFPADLGAEFSREGLAAVLELSTADAAYKVVPGGRELAWDPSDALVERCRRLAAALLPWADAYPMPFFRVED